MKNLIGKKFRYKSKYGGLSNWIGEIKEEFPFYEQVQGPPRKILGRLFYPHRTLNEINYIKCSKGIPYKLDEIEIID